MAPCSIARKNSVKPAKPLINFWKKMCYQTISGIFDENTNLSFDFFFAVSRGKISSNKRKHQFQSPLVVTWTNLYSPGHGSLANEAFEVIFWGKKTSLKFDLPSWSVWLRKIRIFTFLKESKNQLGEDVFDFIYLQLQEDFSNILII